MRAWVKIVLKREAIRVVRAVSVKMCVRRVVRDRGCGAGVRLDFLGGLMGNGF
jgi:hypothetical protein